MRLGKCVCLFCIGLVFICSNALAVALSSVFSMIRLENLVPGESYNTRELVNMPYVLTNKGAFPVVGSLTVIVPVKGMLIKGYENIPDASWIELGENRISLNPGEAISVDIIITVPDEEQYYNKRYQAGIEATARDVGGNIAAGLVSKVCITTVMSKEQAAKVERKKAILANLNYQTLPSKFVLRGVKPGKEYEIGETFGKSFKIVNMNDATYTFRMESMNSETSGLPLERGCENTPDVGWLWFEKSEIKISDNTIRKAKIFLKIPKRKEYYGKKYQLFIKTSLLGQEIPISVYTFVYVFTAEK